MKETKVKNYYVVRGDHSINVKWLFANGEETHELSFSLTLRDGKVFGTFDEAKAFALWLEAKHPDYFKGNLHIVEQIVTSQTNHLLY